MGFDYFYGFMGGETDQWTAVPVPQHHADLSVVGQARLQPDHRDGRRRHRATCNELNAAAPDKPFFLYYVPGGTHAPHQPTQEWIDKFKGKFDMGWNAMREQIFANQKRLGVIPPNTTAHAVAGRTAEYRAKLPKWETLSAEEKKLFARQAEVFAAYVAYTDHEIGRVIQAVEDLGKLDNTLIIYISGDNGTSAEGSTIGTPFDMAALQGIDVPVAEQLKFYDVWGSAETYSAHGGRVGVGLRYAVQVDQAGRVALRRHAAGHGRSRGPTASRMRAASAPNSITSSTSCRRSSKPPASPRRRWSTASPRSRSKA